MQSHKRTSAIATVLIAASLLLIAFGVVLAGGLTPTIVSSPTSFIEVYYFPIIFNQTESISITLSITNASIIDGDTSPQVVFLKSSIITHSLSGTADTLNPISATLGVSHEGPCASGPVFTSTINLAAGAWMETAPVTAPGCTGIFTATTRISHGYSSTITQTQFIVNDVTSPTYTNLHGFDRCTHPTPEEMKAWWDSSPYSVFNLYLGGVHYPSGCQNPAIDAYWVHAVANQGWNFNTVWVGPQAPCTSYIYRMSDKLDDAYLEGKAEAVEAAKVARSLGFFGELIIHYDVEGYSATTSSCRPAVASFIQGWTDQLHELGLKAGAYGSPCRSYLADWRLNDPILDQIWIAHWTSGGYDNTATVWDVPCGFTNDLWAFQQRLKQYAGDHYESWGGVSLGIDSNVFDTSALRLDHTSDLPNPTNLLIQNFDLLDNDTGWVQFGNRLFWTINQGRNWTDISPINFNLLAAKFIDSASGWIVGWSDNQVEIQIGQTTDGGRTWQLSPLTVGENLSSEWIVNANFEVLDNNTLWLMAKLQSGSAFSNGVLFASLDGGKTWEKRNLPIGDPVQFTTSESGWVVGGPAGNEVYRTFDGGLTWQPAEDFTPLFDSMELNSLENLPSNVISIERRDNQVAWVLSQDGSCTGEKGSQTCRQVQALWATENGGKAWTEILLP